jgi:hypothetical protein
VRIYIEDSSPVEWDFRVLVCWFEVLECGVQAYPAASLIRRSLGTRSSPSSSLVSGRVEFRVKGPGFRV